MVGGAALAALALQPITPFAPYVGGFLGIAAGASFAYGKLPLRMAAGIAGAVVLMALASSWPMFAVAAGLLSLGLALGGPRGAKGLGVVAFGTVATLVGLWCATRIVGARETSHWSGYLQSAIGGAAMGMVGVLAALPRHVRIVMDPVAAAVKALPPLLDSEMRGLCDRAVAIWETTEERLADGDAGKSLVRDGVLKTLEVATASRSTKLSGAEAALAQRMTEMDARIAAATDDEVRTQYTAARAALEDQKRYREQIAKGRERLVARMHNHVAALEKFQLAATGVEASRMASQSTTVKQLAELSQDVAASGEALAEIELGLAGAPTAG